MTIVTVRPHSQLSRLLEEADQSHQPVFLTGKHGNGVLLSESDWNALRETLYLHQFPGLIESILQADQEPLDEGTPLEKIVW
ncbi:MAG: type II toxin-antitoxin system Phd/YefM family antitoxin [SAR324 cluster bacterium]|nr:type II toxin-antitoxin system Phd/YefM family antitoxin [SAR324 cluster bacterium]